MDGFTQVSSSCEHRFASDLSSRSDENRSESKYASEEGDKFIQNTVFTKLHTNNFLSIDRISSSSHEWCRELDCGLRSFCTSDRPGIYALFKHRFSDFVVHEITKEGCQVVLSEPLEVDVGCSQINKPYRGKRMIQEIEQAEMKKRCASAIDTHSNASHVGLDVHDDGDPSHPDQNNNYHRDVLDSYQDKFPSFSHLLLLFEKEGVPEEASKEQLVALLRFTSGEHISEFASEARSAESVWMEEGADGRKVLYLDFTGRSKETRTAFHQFVRESAEQLRSETINIGERKTAIRIWYGKDKYDSYHLHPKTSKCKYLTLTVCKENMDTMEMVHLVAKTLGLQPKKVQFAGTKDKRGVTIQRVSIPWVDRDRLARLSRLRNIVIGDVEDSNVGIKLGDLAGNKFRVMLREVSSDHTWTENSDDPSLFVSCSLSAEWYQSVLDACDFVKKFGFINYFGCQRFGTRTVRTHWIGRLCLLGKWREVVECILAPEEKGSSSGHEALESYKLSADAKAALSLLPKKMSIERSILRSLAEHPCDHLRAFQSLVRSMRMMYVHAYQSYIWNEAASKRVDVYGISKVIVGDLVVEDLETLSRSNPDMESDDGKTENEDSPPRSSSSRVLLVDSEKMALQYSIHHVVLPLPGKEVLYPTHQVGKFMSDLLVLHGLDRSFSTDKQFHLSGDYRPLLARPLEFDYTFVAYPSKDQDLIRTIMNCGSSHDLSPNRNDAALKMGLVPNCRVFVPAELSSIDRHSYVGLYLSFSLPSSCYASCLVREVLQRPLDQATLRNAYKRFGS